MSPIRSANTLVMASERGRKGEAAQERQRKRVQQAAQLYGAEGEGGAVKERERASNSGVRWRWMERNAATSD